MSTTTAYPSVENDVLEVAKILYNLRSANYSKAAPKYQMNDTTVESKGGDWIDEKTDEEVIREACSCISRRLDPPERFFDLLRMYDGGELSEDFVTWMNGIPPIRRCMDNKSYRSSRASRQRKNRERTEANARLHPLERTEQKVGFSTNLVNYNLQSLNAVTTTHRYNTRSTTNRTRMD